jgi:hypothetical protein
MGDVVAEALAILTKHKGYAFGLYSSSLGKELAENAISRTAVVNEVFSQIINQGYSNQELIDVSRSFIDSLNPSQMSQILKDTSGAILLVRVKGYLSCYSEKFSSAARCVKIETAFATTATRLPLDVKTSTDSDSNNGNSSIPFAKLKEGQNIRLSPFVIEKLTKIAADYHQATGKSLTITDGNRTAAEQAFLMIPQIEKGKFHLYTNKQAASEVKKVYDAGKASRKSREQIVQDITPVIQNQINNNIFLSRHLRNRGADVRFYDMSGKEKAVFLQIAKKYGGAVVIEDDHYHMQF